MTCSRVVPPYLRQFSLKSSILPRPATLLPQLSLRSRYPDPFRIQTRTLKLTADMSRPSKDKLYISETPKEVSEAKGLHLITMSTPNGQAVQIMLEELADAYGTQWTTTLINIMTNEQKNEWSVCLFPFPCFISSSCHIYTLRCFAQQCSIGQCCSCRCASRLETILQNQC